MRWPTTSGANVARWSAWANIWMNTPRSARISRNSRLLAWSISPDRRPHRLAAVGELRYTGREAQSGVFAMAETAYDTDNIFAKILRGEIPSHRVYEDDAVVAFMDVMP